MKTVKTSKILNYCTQPCDISSLVVTDQHLSSAKPNIKIKFQVISVFKTLISLGSNP